MIKVFEMINAKDLAEAINEFGKTENIVATQIYPHQDGNHPWTAFVYYNTNNGHYKPVTGPKEDTKGMMKEEPELEEIGAAWNHKTKAGFLSVKDKATNAWKNVKVSTLEKQGNELIWKSDDETLIFKPIPEKDRITDKMPHFRAYKVISND